ncbi:MAG: MFS transporter, partial [Actinobacteria bacterium]|nr:MFS transporter [Actinomycetota bacterium]
MSAVRKFFGHVAHPMLWLRGVCGGESAYPLAVLFGLNAVDELDRTAFGILLPNIRDEFGLDNTKVLGLVALSSIAALALQVPIAQYADRSRRVPLAIVGALVWATFSGMTGLAGGVVVLTIARSGSSLGKAVIDPTHNSLLADYYPIEARSKVFSTHRAANAVGAFVGPLSAGMLAYAFGWRVPFLVFVVPTLIFAFLALRLREPVRGKWERAAMGASDEVANTEETVPSFAESWRTVQKIPTLQRLWWSLPFLATALIGFVVLASLLYEQQFGLDERGRGVAAAVAEPFQLVGLVVGTRYITKRFMADMRGLIRFIARVAIGTSVASVGFAFAPNVVIA